MTDKSDYQPVSCEIHSELELAAMRRQPVLLSVAENSHQPPTPVTAIIEDFIIKDGAEYARIVAEGKQSLVRHDQIVDINKKITK